MMIQKAKNRGYVGRALFIFLFSGMLFFPISMAFAAEHGIIPCDGTEVTVVNGQTVYGCTFEHFVKLAQNLINTLILISIPLTAIAFSWAGFLMVTSAGSEEKIKHGKAIFGKVLVGFLFILSAWLIVYTITTALLNNATDYTLLK